MLNDFAPLLASASLLGHFFGQKPGSETVMDSVLAAVKLYNDFTYRRKAEELQQQIATLPSANEVRKRIQQQIEALNASITETRLRLPQT
jgi:hypothetical protein